MVQDTNEHYSFRYDDAEEKRYLIPEDNKKDKNIFGVEYEVNDRNHRKINTYIDNLINKSHICSKDTQDTYKKKIINATLSYDATVHHEIVLQADRPRQVMRKIKILNEFLNPKNVLNGTGTSMHIHANAQYISNLGLSDLDIVKAGEAISSVLYAISGRKEDYELRRWVKTRVFKPLFLPIKYRCQYIDNICLGHDDYTHDIGHYKMVNVSNNDTIEFRIFSNYHNFDYNHSKICIELVNVVFNIAEAMQGLEYATNYEIPIDIVSEFFDSIGRRRKYYNNIEETLLKSDEEYRNIIIRTNYNNVLNELNNEFSHGSISQVLAYIRDMQSTYNTSYDNPIIVSRIEESFPDIAQCIAEARYEQNPTL